MKKVSRESITENFYQEMLQRETHHSHEIVEDDSGILRWKADPFISEIARRINLNDLIPLLHALGHDKNSELYRNLYRNMGYSLYGYWEIFYWEVNNPQAHLYQPPAHGSL